jgi:hypothetical protein
LSHQALELLSVQHAQTEALLAQQRERRLEADNERARAAVLAARQEWAAAQAAVDNAAASEPYVLPKSDKQPKLKLVPIDIMVELASQNQNKQQHELGQSGLWARVHAARTSLDRARAHQHRIQADWAAAKERVADAQRVLQQAKRALEQVSSSSSSSSSASAEAAPEAKAAAIMAAVRQLQKRLASVEIAGDSEELVQLRDQLAAAQARHHELKVCCLNNFFLALSLSLC